MKAVYPLPHSRSATQPSRVIFVAPAATGATTLSPAGLDHGRAIGTGPKVSPSLGPASLTHTRALGTAPTVSSLTTLTPASLTHSRAIGTGPQVNVKLGPSGLAHSRAIGTGPKISPSIVLAGLTHTRTLGGPAAATNVTVTVTSLVHDRALGQIGQRGPGFRQRRRVPDPEPVLVEPKVYPERIWPERDLSRMRPIFRRTRR